MDYVTVSTKVSRSLMEKARKYGINLSELMRKAIEEEVRKSLRDLIFSEIDSKRKRHFLSFSSRSMRGDSRLQLWSRLRSFNLLS